MKDEFKESVYNEDMMKKFPGIHTKHFQTLGAGNDYLPQLLKNERDKREFSNRQNNSNITTDARKTAGVKISTPDNQMINSQIVPNTMRSAANQNFNNDSEVGLIQDQKLASFYNENDNQRRIHTRTKSYSKHIVRRGQERITKSDFYQNNLFLRRQGNTSVMS